MNEEISTNDEFEYTPGKCNIGLREIRRRKLTGGIGLFLTIITIFSFYHQHSSRIARFGTFLPALIMSIGYLQARKKFCFAFGLSGLFNFGSSGQSHRVISEVDRKIDRRAALRLILEALALAAVVTAIVFLLPASNK